MNLSNRKGFSMVEIIVVLTIAGILLAIGVPGYLSLIQNNKVVSATNKLAASLNLARIEAIKRGLHVGICPANSALTACGTSSQWTQGWIVFADANNNNSVDSSTDLISVTNALPQGSTVTSTSAIITYDSTGFLASNAASINLNATGCTGLNARTVNVNTNGRVSVVPVNCT
jgi:type IV fimbrial biogenesis protein FimT